MSNFRIDIYGERVAVMISVMCLFDGVWAPVALLPAAEAMSRFGHRLGTDIRFM
jgi:hypothetical protein